ncbi:hypothetical protein [Wenjunlia tyrosinilytica]|uniref:Uncharacterized protein n=1 Tax=Wenjunlia tyrosinilytica TaxID=1544741 RepID=A0A918DZZ9_9ACTN|nr:hypothetical protein GCM10012280_57900 [Wenjunlia tyrosinilytica]
MGFPRREAAATAAATCALSLSACGSGGGGAGDTADASGKVEGTVAFRTWWRPARSSPSCR